MRNKKQWKNEIIKKWRWDENDNEKKAHKMENIEYRLDKRGQYKPQSTTRRPYRFIVSKKNHN